MTEQTTEKKTEPVTEQTSQQAKPVTEQTRQPTKPVAEQINQQTKPNTTPKANPMRDIRIAQISLNIGAGKDEDKMKKAVKLLTKISGKTPVKTTAKKRIPGWGLRPGLSIGCKVNIRKNVNEMLKRLLEAKENTLSQKNFDQCGNLSFGIPEYIDIQGIEYDPELKIMGLEVAVVLERPGFRVKKRKIKTQKIGKTHLITKEEAIKFIQKTFDTNVE